MGCYASVKLSFLPDNCERLDRAYEQLHTATAFSPPTFSGSLVSRFLFLLLQAAPQALEIKRTHGG